MSYGIDCGWCTKLLFFDVFLILLPGLDDVDDVRRSLLDPVASFFLPLLTNPRRVVLRLRLRLRPFLLPVLFVLLPSFRPRRFVPLWDDAGPGDDCWCWVSWSWV